jgi:hypothetical protein
VFMLLFFAYIEFFSVDRFMRDAGILQVFAFALVMVLNQALLAAIQLIALFRREETFALLCAVLVLPLNAGMIAVTMIFHVPGWAYLLVLAAAVAGALALAWLYVRMLWPPQLTPHKE